LTVCFPAYSGSNDFDSATAKIREFFLSVNQRSYTKRAIYTHETCATDTSNVRHVFFSVKDIIMRSTMKAMGIDVY